MTTGSPVKAGGTAGVFGSGDGYTATGCRCSRCQPEANWEGTRRERRAAKKAKLPKPKAEAST